MGQKITTCLWFDRNAEEAIAFYAGIFDDVQITATDLYLEGGAPVAARVHDVENHGVAKIVTLRMGDSLLQATVPTQTSLRIDEEVRFSWHPEKVVLFDGSSGINLRHAG